MSTDLRPAPLHEPGAPRPAATKPKIDLSFTQVAGGALAAMTAAFLGSRLSVAGTVVGAAMASVVAAVASNLYTASLQTTREKVQTVFRGRTAGSGVPVSLEPRPDADQAPSLSSAAGHAPAAAVPVRSRIQWRSVVVGALAAFALAVAVLTGLELASGQSLSGGQGTTISQVAEQKPAADPTTDPTTAATASPSATASESPEPSASASGSSEPSATPSAAEPTSSASDAPSSSPTPSDTATPSAGDGSADEGSGTEAQG
ncbi:hypothetical protein [uncultured Friedmanniella sp.]|uniref:hypothetical protein n=1 Tax=uncultured Friedmanniella sp. TaxID=335381 RepID=UPI0035C9F349